MKALRPRFGVVLLVVAATALAVSLVGAITQVTRGFNSAIATARDFSSQGADLVVAASSTDDRGVPRATATAIRTTRGVERVIERISLTVQANGESVLLEPWVEPDRFEIARGRSPTREGELTVEEGVAASLGLSVGDGLEVRSASATRSGTIVGIARFASSQAGAVIADQYVHAVEAEVRAHAPNLAAATELLVYSDGSDQDRIRRAVDATAADLAVVDPALGAGGPVEERQTAFLSLINAARLLVVAVGAFIAWAALGSEFSSQRRRIGLLRSIAATAGQVVAVLLLWSLALAFVGFVLGLALTVVWTEIVSRGADADALPLLEPVPSAGTAAALLAMAVVLNIVATILPAVHASRLRPIEALRGNDSAARTTSRARQVGRAVIAATFILVGAWIDISVGVLIGALIAVAFASRLVLPALFRGVASALRPWRRLFPEELAAREIGAKTLRPLLTASAVGAAMVVGILATSAARSVGDSAAAAPAFQSERLVIAEGNVLRDAATASAIENENVTAIALHDPGFLFVPSGPPSELALADIGAAVENLDRASITEAALTFGDGSWFLPNAALTDLARIGEHLVLGEVRFDDVETASIWPQLVADWVGVSEGDAFTAVFHDGSTVGFEVTKVVSGVDLPVAVLLHDSHEASLGIPRSLLVSSLAESNAMVDEISGQSLPGDEYRTPNGVASERIQTTAVVVALLTIAAGLSVVAVQHFGAIQSRRRELSILRAVGMTRSELQRLSRSEAMFASGSGLLFGLIAGLPTAWLVLGQLPSALVPNPKLWPSAVGALAALFILSAVVVAATAVSRILQEHWTEFLTD